MAIDQTPPPSAPASKPTAAIDNEFPTYRAISSAAVASLLLGLASIFCFASLYFLVLAAGALVLGLLSIRKIHRVPDILTGSSFARVGIALALVFGVSSVTKTVAQEIMTNIDAGRFASHYVEVIKKEPLNTALWYQQPPAYRKTKSPADIAAELRKVKGQGGLDVFTERTAGLAKMQKRLAGKDEKIRFARIESKAEDGLTTYANALVELDGPGSKDVPAEEFALVEMVKGNEGWVVKNVTFPYTPASTIAVIEHKVDDGHGH